MQEETDLKPTKAMEVAKEAAKGSLFMFAGNASSTLILALKSIVIARLLGPSDYGLYSVALIAPSLMLLFTDFGIGSALVRFIARFKSEGRGKSIGILIETAFIFKVVVSITVLLLTFFLADILAAHLLNRPGIGSLIRLSSLVIVGNVLLTTSSSIFVGLDRARDGALTITGNSTTH